MAIFYQNLKLILDQQNLSNYEAANKCGIPSQTIDNIINNKVKKPKFDTLEKLSLGLGVSINKLIYGSDCFNKYTFDEALEKKGVTIEDIVIKTGADPIPLINYQFPSEKDQQAIANYLGVKVKSLFIPSFYGHDYLLAQKVKPYVRPDINIDPKTDEDIMKLYSNLSPVSKRLIYNLAYDLAYIETENIVQYTRKDYWEKAPFPSNKKKTT